LLQLTVDPQEFNKSTTAKIMHKLTWCVQLMKKRKPLEVSFGTNDYCIKISGVQVGIAAFKSSSIYS